jgi:antitoxin PrlF
MSDIYETSTITSKGQITLPKLVRQALGVTTGSKVLFSVRNGEVVVTRAEDVTHQDPAIEAFLGVLERDIRAGKNVQTLPGDLAKSMLAYSDKKVDHDEAIEGDVAI